MRTELLRSRNFGEMAALSSFRNLILRNVRECPSRRFLPASSTMFCRPRRLRGELKRLHGNSMVFQDRRKTLEAIAVNRENIATFAPEATARRKNANAIFRKAVNDVA